MAHHLTLAHSLLMYGRRTADRQAAVGPEGRGVWGAYAAGRVSHAVRSHWPAPVRPHPQPSSAVDRYRGGDLCYALPASRYD